FYVQRRPAAAAVYPLPLHDALPISGPAAVRGSARTSAVMTPPKSSTRQPSPTRPSCERVSSSSECASRTVSANGRRACHSARKRSEEHTSELQSQSNLVCRLLLEN